MSSLNGASPSHRPLASSRRPSSQRSQFRRRRVLALAVLPFLVAPSLAAGIVAAAPPAVAPVDAKPITEVIGSAADTLADLAAPAAPVASVAIGSEPAAAVAAVPGKTKFDGSSGSSASSKDVPFDGKDGRPHEGPFVEVENSRKDDPAQKTSVYIDGKKVPESNDGVMDDKNRVAPKHGTTGMTGGVSEKDKQRKAKEGQTGERVENTPETPKEVPALPHHEEEKMNGQSGSKDSKDDKTKESSGNDGSGFEKPTDLPDKTHDKAIPVPGSAQKDHLDVPKSSTDKIKLPAHPDGDDSASIIHPFHSFVLSLTMILFSEVGDKTFLVAALMAMKHDRIVVFTAAFSALFAMTVLSAVLGHAVPVLIPKRMTNFLAAGLFLVFGAKLLREGMQMGADEGVGAEMQEVELELAEKETQARENNRRLSRAGGGVLSPDTLEMGLGGPGARLPRSQSRFSTPNRSASSSLSPPRGRGNWGGAGNGDFLSTVKGLGSGLSNLASLLLSPAWVQTFVMTFLGEWGDRSQIATVAMAAGQDYWWVTLGAVTGHACCTGVAVIGGRALAGRVSMKAVTIGGAVSFIVFGIIYLFEALNGA
ncbi:transmembrane protein pft27 [Ophiostoma piceae UAMH 11346]|uniref:Transmembrane protein pft27 n=1 Tax=Ophiostoma piceae (strain UAMH 11346) TaxID=1262450 RepID=S3CUW8_OPHP1|nr:transmembrane protein pft27 [Ophiostoma piceae UAMH 11346]